MLLTAAVSMHAQVLHFTCYTNSVLLERTTVYIVACLHTPPQHTHSHRDIHSVKLASHHINNVNEELRLHAT